MFSKPLYTKLVHYSILGTNHNIIILSANIQITDTLEPALLSQGDSYCRGKVSFVRTVIAGFHTGLFAGYGKGDSKVVEPCISTNALVCVPCRGVWGNEFLDF